MNIYNENRFKKLREETETDSRKSLTQSELSKKIMQKCNIYIPQTAISKLENNEIPLESIKSHILIGYSKFFNVSTDYLLNLSDNRSKDPTIKAIGKRTGLNDNAINKMTDIKKRADKGSEIDKDNLNILNYILSMPKTNERKEFISFEYFLNKLNIYINNPYTIPVYVPDETEENKQHSAFEKIPAKYIGAGELTKDNAGNYGYNVIGMKDFSTLVLQSTKNDIDYILKEWQLCKNNHKK